MSCISIHLSSSDLEKILLDKNGELNIVISEQIANKFASKYLKSIIHNEGKFLFITYPTGYKDFDLVSLDENPSQEDFCKSMDAIKNRLTKFLLFVNMWANNGLNKSNLEEK